MLGLFVISAALLTLEVLQTRLFAYGLDTFLFYGAVAVTLLGLGASGTVLASWRGWRDRLGTLCAVAAAGFAVSLVAAHALFARTSSGLFFDLSPRALSIFAALAIPYFFAGIVVTASLAASGTSVHRTYMANLLGSAAGCFVVFFALKPLGAPQLLGVTALTGVAAGLCFLRLEHDAWARRALVVAGLIVSVALAVPERVFPFRPEHSGQLAGLERRFTLQPLLQVWDPTGRIEVHALPDRPAALPDPVPVHFYSQDGSAGSILLGVGDDVGRARAFFERTLYGAPYALRGDGGVGAKVLVIGLGGGPDVQAAHFFKAVSVTGVEINESAIAAVAGPFATFTGDPYGRPNARAVHLDGRTFVRSTRETFDVIVMSGVDTKAVLAAGSLSISENHLYTVEAFDEYLDRLTPDGVLAMLRFGQFDRLRLATLGVAALRARGVAQPERHFAVLEQRPWTTVLVGREPLLPAALARLAAWVASIPTSDTGVRLPPYDAFGLGLGRPPRLLYPVAGTYEDGDAAALFAAVAAGREDEFIASYSLDISPTTDDRPFFFDQQRRDRLVVEPSPVYRKLGAYLAAISLLALVAVAAPVPLLRRESAGRGLLRVLTYFGALGMGFMLLEIGLAQKLVLFLGHPSYSVTLVLAALLVGAGCGSAVVGRATLGGADLVRRVAVPSIVLVGLGLAFGLDPLARACAGLPLAGRLAVAAIAIGALGFGLGMPFPAGLALLARERAVLVPWAIGANGLASVVGASSALPAAMLFGYRAVLAAGLVAYVMVALTVPAARE